MKEQMNKNKNLSARDYEFMHSLSSAVLQVTPMKFRVVLFFWAIAVFAFIIWANFAVIDELARGNGEIIPSCENQIVQNLEGGIVEGILVKEGQIVKKNQILIKINNEKSQSSFSSNSIKVKSLEAQIMRLKAESEGTAFIIDKKIKEEIPQFIQNEESLYNTNKQQLYSKVEALKEKLIQRRNELSEAKTAMKHLKSSTAMIQKEVLMTQPMVERGVSSKRDFLKLQREANGIEQKYEATRKSIPRLESAIKEVQNNVKEATLFFQSEAKVKLNETVTQLKEMQANSTALEDQVQRTIVRSPMNGIVQKLFVHTVGGVIRPGADIMEIVPSDQALLVEVKIKPSDIAFIYLGQKAIVKFSAYDFSIYGGLEGKVVFISADSVKDEKENVFYTVRIKTDKSHLGNNAKLLKIIPGMTVSVDIITGRKSVLDYILKPILKTKQYTFTER